MVDMIVNYPEMCEYTPSISKWADHIKIELENKNGDRSMQIVLAEKKFLMMTLKTPNAEHTFIMQDDGLYWVQNDVFSALYSADGQMVDLMTEDKENA